MVGKTLGLDLGKTWAWAVIDEEGLLLDFGWEKSEKDQIGERIADFHWGVLELTYQFEIARLGVEEPPYVQNARTHRDLCALWSQALFVAECDMIPYLSVKPGEIKKLATGLGNCNKQAMLAAFERETGVKNVPHDVADAFWVARFAKENI